MLGVGERVSLCFSEVIPGGSRVFLANKSPSLSLYV